MTTQKLTIYNFNDIATKKLSIKHQNAFIFPDGTFCLSEGYTGCDSSQQLEQTALKISREILGIHDLKTRYQIHLQQLLNQGMSQEEVSLKKLYYLRGILVHYYGYGLFARVQRMDSSPNVEQFWDSSMLPNPIYNNKTATIEQISTLKALFVLNNDGTVLPSLNEESIENDIDKLLKLSQSNIWNKK